jgi:serine protease Do
VPQNGPGATQGLRAGDLVVAAGETPIATPDDVQQHIAGAKKAGRKNVLIRVERDGNFRFVTLPIEEG